MALPLMALLKEEGAIDEPVSRWVELENGIDYKIISPDPPVGIGAVNPSTELHIVQYNVPLCLDQRDLSDEFIRFNSIT